MCNESGQVEESGGGNSKSEIRNPKGDSGARPFFIYSDRDPRKIEWLYPGLIPLGKVTLLIGDPGVGKSLLAVDLVARVTRGEGLPPTRKKRDPARVLYLAGDGETEDILPERLAAFGADLARVAGIEAVDESQLSMVNGQLSRSDDDDSNRTIGGGQWSMVNGQLHNSDDGDLSRTIDHQQSTIDYSTVRFFSLRHDVARIEETLAAWPDCRLVVIDPVSAFLDGVDANSNMDVRRLLTRLSWLARRHHTAVLVISHFRKAYASTLLYRSLGSIAFTLATRVVLTLAADPVEAGRRLLLPAKMNPLPEEQQHGRAFSISLNKLTWEPDPVVIGCEELRDLNAVSLHADERVEQIGRWLISLLSEQRRPAREIAQLARDEHIPQKLLYAARRLAKVQLERDPASGKWYWKLPTMFVFPEWAC